MDALPEVAVVAVVAVTLIAMVKAVAIAMLKRQIIITTITTKAMVEINK